MLNKAMAPVRFLRSWRGPASLTLVGGVIASLLFMEGSRAVTKTWSLNGSVTILPATVRASRMFTVTTEEPGRVLSIAVSPGQFVRAGQEVVVLENGALVAAQAEASKQMEEATRRIAEGAGSGLRGRIYSEQQRMAEAAYKLACARYEQFDLKQAGEGYRIAAERTKAVEQLVKEGAATSTELTRQRDEERSALRSFTEAREHHNRLQQECQAARAQFSIAKLQFDLDRKAGLESAKAEYLTASARARASGEQQDKLRLYTPQAGTVVSVSVASGDRVPAGVVVAQIADLSQLIVETPVSGKIARLIQKGESVLVRLPTDPPAEIEAPIESVLLTAGDTSHPYIVRVRIRNPDPDTIVAGLDAAVVFRHVLKTE
jgi:multidrug efflux pump subunit AcrA (membrane-fusion protein)